MTRINVDNHVPLRRRQPALSAPFASSNELKWGQWKLQDWKMTDQAGGAGKTTGQGKRPSEHDEFSPITFLLFGASLLDPVFSAPPHIKC